MEALRGSTRLSHNPRQSFLYETQLRSLHTRTARVQDPRESHGPLKPPLNLQQGRILIH